MRYNATVGKWTTKKPPEETPCGYCFSKWATGYDHLIPVSYKVINTDENLYPSCRRCNSMLSNRMFRSLDEKREYARRRLIELGKWEPIWEPVEMGNWAVPLLPEKVSEDASAPKVLLPKVQVGTLERSASTKRKGERVSKKRPSGMVLGAKQKCAHCQAIFTVAKTWQIYCSGKCRRLAWFSKTYRRIDSGIPEAK